jgi:hypothetical protein
VEGRRRGHAPAPALFDAREKGAGGRGRAPSPTLFGAWGKGVEGRRPRSGHGGGGVRGEDEPQIGRIHGEDELERIHGGRGARPLSPVRGEEKLF